MDRRWTATKPKHYIGGIAASAGWLIALERLTTALTKLVAEDKARRQSLGRCAINGTKETCALQIRPLGLIIVSRNDAAQEMSALKQ